MTFNTGNPIGSTDARDLSDNAENFDKALGTLDATWVDRLGVTRDSFEGRLANGSFYRVGDFTTGYTLTNMRQTLEYSGHEYSWAGAFPKVVAAGATPATSGGIGAGAWVDRTDLTVRSELTAYINALANNKFDTLADAAAADLPVGYEFSVNDTVFHVSDAKPTAAYVPVINGFNGTYLVPVANCLNNNFTNTNIATAQAVAYSYAGLTVANQAIYVDNRANSILFSICDYTQTPHKFKIVEYSYIGGVIGSKLLETGWIASGHGDYFALVYQGINRYLWWHSPTSTTYGAGKLCSVVLANGVTAATITLNYPSAYSSMFFRIEDGADNTLRLMCPSGTWDVDVFSLPTGSTLSFDDLTAKPYVEYALTGNLPNQARRTIGDGLVTLWGGDTSKWGTCGLSHLNADGYLTLPLDIPTVPTGSGSEPQGLSFVWDSATCKFNALITVIHATTSANGTAYLLDTSAGASNNSTASAVINSRYSTSLELPTYDTATLYNASSSPMYAPALLVGGVDSGATTEEQAADQFYLTQAYPLGNSSGRRQANIKYKDTIEMVLDHYSDSNFPAGMRFLVGGGASGITASTPLQIRSRVITFGAQRAKGYTDTFYPRAEFIGSISDQLIPGGYTSGVIGQVFGCTLDIAAESGTVLQFGDYNKTTGAYNIWYNMNASNFHAGTDNTRACGVASIRWSVVYAATGTINTSDEREKTFCDEELSDAVLDVWSGINWRTFKFNDAVVEKGEAARVHFGLGAQTIKNAFEAAGLDPFRYALLCYDEWDETPAQYGENGNEIAAAIPAGNRYGIRYEEALALEAALLRRTTLRLDARLAALEAK